MLGDCQHMMQNRLWSSYCEALLAGITHMMAMCSIYWQGNQDQNLCLRRKYTLTRQKRLTATISYANQNHCQNSTSQVYRLLAINWLLSLRYCHDMLRKRNHNMHEIAVAKVSTRTASCEPAISVAVLAVHCNDSVPGGKSRVRPGRFNANTS